MSHDMRYSGNKPNTQTCRRRDLCILHFLVLYCFQTKKKENKHTNALKDTKNQYGTHTACRAI